MKSLVALLLIIVLIEGWVIYRSQNTGQRVLLPPYSFSEIDPKYSDDFFYANGSWVSDTQLAYPAQTTEINCYKDYGFCFETNANLTDDNFLAVHNDLHEINLWTKEVISTKPNKTAAGCVEYTMKIDRVNKKVISLRTTVDNTSSSCKGTEDKPIVLQLGNGQERQDKIKQQLK